MRSSLLLALVSCSSTDDPSGLETSCPDPRETPTFDHVVIPGEAADERRFWGGGIVAGDFDGDGDLDLFVPGPASARLLRNDAGTYVDDPEAVPAIDWTRTAGGAAADYDADGDLDLAITRWGLGVVLLENEDGRFSASDGIPPTPSHDQSAAWADADGDGDLDLVVAGHGEAKGGEQVVVDEPGDPTRLWLGDGAGGFVDGSARLPERARDSYGFVAGWTEIDGDGRPDLYLANDYPIWSPSFALLNQGDAFVYSDSLGLTLPNAGMGLGLGDANGDGVEDLLMPVWNNIIVAMSSPIGWASSADALGIELPAHDGRWIGWGAEWADIDNDGDLDGITAFGRLDTIGLLGPSGGSAANAEVQRFAVYEQHDGLFTERAEAFGLDDPGVWRGFVVADLNGDGWPDLAKRDLAGPIVLALSQCGSAAWLKVVPEPPDRAVGAVVTVMAAGLTQVRTVHAGGTSINSGGPPELLFGLGRARQVNRVEVRWPDGEITTVEDPAVRTTVVVR